MEQGAPPSSPSLPSPADAPPPPQTPKPDWTPGSGGNEREDLPGVKEGLWSPSQEEGKFRKIDPKEAGAGGIYKMMISVRRGAFSPLERVVLTLPTCRRLCVPLLQGDRILSSLFDAFSLPHPLCLSARPARRLLDPSVSSRPSAPRERRTSHRCRGSTCAVRRFNPLFLSETLRLTLLTSVLLQLTTRLRSWSLSLTRASSFSLLRTV